MMTSLVGDIGLDRALVQHLLTNAISLEFYEYDPGESIHTLSRSKCPAIQSVFHCPAPQLQCQLTRMPSYRLPSKKTLQLQIGNSKSDFSSM